MTLFKLNPVKGLQNTLWALFSLFLVSCNQPEPVIQTLERLAYVTDGNIHISGLSDQTHSKAGKGNEPSVSVDGRYLAYVANIGNKQRIAILDFPNSNTKIIDDVQGTAWNPAWSPTENRFLFSAMAQGESNGYRVVIVSHPHEDKKYVLSRPGIDIFSPVWAPDGETVFGHDTQLMYQWEKTGLLINHFSLSEKFGPLNFNSSTIIFPSADGSKWLIATTKQEPNANTRGRSLIIHIFNEADLSLKKVSPDGVFISGLSWGRDNHSIFFSGKTRRNQRQNDIYELNTLDNKFTQLVKNATQPYFRAIKVVEQK